MLLVQFEGIAKTNTTHTGYFFLRAEKGLRVLLKQIQHIQENPPSEASVSLRVLLKQIQHIQYEINT